MDTQILTLLITNAVVVLGSTGFWTYVTHRRNHRSSSDKLLLGIAHDRIYVLSRKYLERGWVSIDELENLNTYLYAPYLEKGGNGLITQLVKRVYALPSSPEKGDLKNVK